MSLSHSPKIVTSGLVFAYDMGNGKKSWKGAPTTNLITASLSGMQGVSLTFLSLDNGWKKYAMSGTFTAGTYPYTMNMTSTSFTGGVTYSSSCFIKTNVAYKFNYFGTGMNYVNQAMTKAGTSFSIAQPDGSLYVGRSNFAYTATTTQVGYLLTNPINNTTFNASTDFVWFKNGQVELGEFPTPFAGDSATRSNTQALLDWAGNNTVTASSLTYNSDGSFSFDASKVITVPMTNLKPVSAITQECWFRTTNNNTQVFIGSQYGNGSNNSYALWINGANGWAGGVNTTGTFNYQTQSTTLLTNVWYHFVHTYDGTNQKLYINGINVRTWGTTGNIIYGTNNTLLAVGNDWNSGYNSGASNGVKGQMPIAKIYNKALTAAEVTQNFNALRGRYGI